MERKQRLEHAIKGLQKEKKDTEKLLKVHLLTEEQIASIQAFADDVGEGLLETDEDFVARRRLVECWI